MVKERLKSPRAKLFIALDLPDAVRAGIAAWGEGELTDAALRPVAAESLHITLAFLGWRPEKEVPRLAEIVGEQSRVAAPPIELDQPVQRPERGRPRLFALPVVSPPTIAIQARLQEKLVAAGLYEPERRPFWPHVTVARVKREERGSKRPAPVDKLPGPLPAKLRRTSVCRRMTLYRSEIQPRGAHYVPLAQVELPDGGQQ